MDSEIAFFEKAKAISPTLKRLEFEGYALRNDAVATSAAIYPQFVIRGERIQSNVPTSYSDNRLIAALQFQPGAGFSALSNSKAAESKASAAERDLEKARLDLRDKCATIYNDMVSSAEQVVYLTSLTKSNKNIVASTLRQFQASKRSWVDVMNAQRDAVQTELSFADALYNSQMNQSHAQKACNRNLYTSVETSVTTFR